MFTQKAFRYVLVAASLTIGSSLAYARGMFPDIKVSKDGKVEVQQDGVGKATISPNPASGPPRIEGKTGNPDIDNAIKNADGAAHLPQDAVKAAGDAVGKAVESEVNKIIEGLKKKFWSKYEELKKQALPYLYMAAAAFVLTLMLPGFIGALFAIWVVNALNRRRARKQERQLKKALSVVKNQADEIQTKLAA